MTWAWAQPAVPELRARVTDQTNTLNAAQISALEQTLSSFEQQKGSQIAVLIVPTTEPETIEQYSIRVVDTWKLGRENIDDGALLLIAKNDRGLRIEVGQGLEGALPDALAKRIIEETITPLFRQGDFYAGIDAGVSQMIGVISGEALPEPSARDSGGGEDNFRNLDWLIWAFFLLCGAGTGLKKKLGVLPVSGLVGLGTGAVAGWMIGLMQAGLVAGGIAAVLAFLFYVMDLGRGGGGYGGYSSGGSYSGGGGGSFGGGGGGFSGGGASGRW